MAQAEINVLILGETGVGKEVLARHVHQASPRAAGPLLKLCCASLAPSLVERELFGHVKGAFTGATTDQPGLIESADRGTVFLDEIGELDLSMQTRLLQVIEERVVRRVGSVAANPVDVRFVAATNRDLEADVAAGRFRSDLYFRIAGFTLLIPPLRSRLDEIAPLAETIARQLGHTAGVAPSARAELEGRVWPGNVRELRNTIERAVILAAGAQIGPEHLSAGGGRGAHNDGLGPADEPLNLREAIEATERRCIARALEQASGNQTEAAKLLGVSRQTLVSRLDAYHMPRPRKSG